MTHNISPSSGSLPSAVTVLVSFTACLAFFLDFFPCKKRNHGHKVENNSSASDKRKDWGGGLQWRYYAAHMISHPRTTTGQVSPDTQMSMLKPSLFISETTPTVQDSLNGTGPICKHCFHLLVCTQLHLLTSAPSGPQFVLFCGMALYDRLHLAPSSMILLHMQVKNCNRTLAADVVTSLLGDS